MSGWGVRLVRYKFTFARDFLKICALLVRALCYTETGFGSGLVLQTVNLLSETFLKPKLVVSFILLKPKPVFETIKTTSRGGLVCPNIGAVREKWWQVNDKCC